ncbi:hypothetical protein BLOT_012490 [Blomia tropicalis]|nr:hypothetical protein BLOT_012490 [Blomia tropicalis]
MVVEVYNRTLLFGMFNDIGRSEIRSSIILIINCKHLHCLLELYSGSSAKINVDIDKIIR